VSLLSKETFTRRCLVERAAWSLLPDSTWSIEQRNRLNHPQRSTTFPVLPVFRLFQGSRNLQKKKLVRCTEWYLEGRRRSWPAVRI
jgi:hypothetical protein